MGAVSVAQRPLSSRWSQCLPISVGPAAPMPQAKLLHLSYVLLEIATRLPYLVATASPG